MKNGKPRVAPIGVESNFKEGYINYCQTYARRLCMPVTSSSVAIPREVFQESGGFRTGIALGEDFDLWIRIALKHGVALVNRPLAYYFQDIPTGGRATRRIHAPASHMLWNLDYLADEEARNPDYKLLIDVLTDCGDTIFQGNIMLRLWLSCGASIGRMCRKARIDCTIRHCGGSGCVSLSVQGPLLSNRIF